jgi:hypothetical protein
MKKNFLVIISFLLIAGMAHGQIADRVLRNAKVYTDTQLPIGTGKLFYRLKQVDMDGRFTYSPVVTIVINRKGNEIIATPNPTKNEITFSTFAGKAKVEIYNHVGQHIKTSQVQSGIAISIQELANGVYYFKLFDNTGNKILQSGKFIKVK